MEKRIYTISQHAKERYAERLLGKDATIEIQSFIVQNEEKILNDINKMLTYGEFISSSERTKDNVIQKVGVYHCDCWILLVDEDTAKVITLYKIDLGCGDDFNKTYIERMLERIREAQKASEDVVAAVDEETATYKQLIEQNNDQIKEFKSFIKNLEALNEGYGEIIKNNQVKVRIAHQNVNDIVNTLINKKVF